MPDAPTRSDREPAALVWDLPLRLCHWLLTVAVLGSFASHWLGPRAFAVHIACGSVVLVLVAFRIAWGFAGSRYALFAGFVRGPRAVLAYLRADRAAPSHGAGHNPLGGWMVLLLLSALLVQAATGLVASDRVVEAGPLYGYLTPSASKLLTRIHHRVAVVLEIAVPLHVAAVLYFWARGEDLVRSMLTGRKPGRPLAESVVNEHLGRALLILLFAVLALGALILSAPPAELAID